jgi:hypothetical protein
MRDRVLIALVVVAAILFSGHVVDHVARGDVRWPLSADSVVFIIVVVTVYAIIGFGLHLYLKGKVGPLFWALTGGIGLAFGWFGHFSPFTDQPPRHILNSYSSAAVGWLALGCLVALMLVLVIAVAYAVHLWARQNKPA